MNAINWDDVDYVDARTILFSRDGISRASTIPYSFPYDPTLLPVQRNEDSSKRRERPYRSRCADSENAMGYVGYSRGCRTGTYDGSAYQDIDQIYYVEPEVVDAYEVGFKSRLAADRVQLNVALFSYDYTNQQISEIVGVTPFLRTVDGGALGRRARIDVGRCRTPDYFFDPFGDDDGQYAGSPELSGLPRASRELGAGNPSYWIVDARLSHRSNDLEIAAWVKNLTDEL